MALRATISCTFPKMIKNLCLKYKESQNTGIKRQMTLGIRDQDHPIKDVSKEALDNICRVLFRGKLMLLSIADYFFKENKELFSAAKRLINNVC